MQDTTNWCKYIILEAGNNLDKLKPPKIVVSNDDYFTPGTYPHRTCYLIFVNTKMEKLGLFFGLICQIVMKHPVHYAPETFKM